MKAGAAGARAAETQRWREERGAREREQGFSRKTSPPLLPPSPPPLSSCFHARKRTQLQQLTRRPRCAGKARQPFNSGCTASYLISVVAVADCSFEPASDLRPSAARAPAASLFSLSLSLSPVDRPYLRLTAACDTRQPAASLPCCSVSHSVGHSLATRLSTSLSPSFESPEAAESDLFPLSSHPLVTCN